MKIYSSGNNKRKDPEGISRGRVIIMKIIKNVDFIEFKKLAARMWQYYEDEVFPDFEGGETSLIITNRGDKEYLPMSSGIQCLLCAANDLALTGEIVIQTVKGYYGDDDDPFSSIIFKNGSPVEYLRTATAPHCEGESRLPNPTLV